MENISPEEKTLRIFTNEQDAGSRYYLLKRMVISENRFCQDIQCQVFICIFIEKSNGKPGIKSVTKQIKRT